jgi:predicted ATPase
MLQPLVLEDVCALVHDTCVVNRAGAVNMEDLASPEEIAEVRAHELELAKAIHNKTEGNPFFINQLLTMLHQDGHIYLQIRPVPHWVCNMAQIKVDISFGNEIFNLYLFRQQIIQITL